MISLETSQEFVIVDFDRTLVDSDKLLEVFIEVAGEFVEIPAEQIEAADRDVKLRGDSFDTASFVRDYLNRDGKLDHWDKLTKKFIHDSRALNYLLPGALELLNYLQHNKINHGILTYGNPLWQHLKLSAAGFNHVPRIVMENKEKGRFVASWCREDGQYKLPAEYGGSTVKNVVLIDDKAVSFADLPEEGARGIWVLDPANELPSQVGTVPENVRRVSTLADPLNLL